MYYVIYKITDEKAISDAFTELYNATCYGTDPNGCDYFVKECSNEYVMQIFRFGFISFVDLKNMCKTLNDTNLYENWIAGEDRDYYKPKALFVWSHID